MKKEIKNLSEQVAAFAQSQAYIDGLLRKAPCWLTADSEHGEVILSTRIRLARNFRAFPFPAMAKRQELEKVLELTRTACGKIKLLEEARYLDMKDLDEIGEKILVERRLISPAFANAPHPRLVAIGASEFASIMVNEEDHLRIQAIQPGLALQEAWRLISRLDDELSEQVDYAFSPQFGYLTSCPTNVGTGMRASIQIHLPALALQQQVEKVIKNLAPSEIAVRGFYGEGSEIMGNIYQISNQLTLGRTETAIVNRLEVVAHQFVEREQEARGNLFEQARLLLEDKVFRALAILQSARQISSQEFLKRLSYVRLGVDLGLIKGLELNAMSELMLLTQPAHMQKLHGTFADAESRDVLRAEIIRQKFKIH